MKKTKNCEDMILKHFDYHAMKTMVVNWKWKFYHDYTPNILQ